MTIFTLALPQTAGLLLEADHPSPLSARFVAGAGQLIWGGMNAADEQQVTTGFTIVALLCLAADLLLGLLHFRFLRS